MSGTAPTGIFKTAYSPKAATLNVNNMTINLLLTLKSIIFPNMMLIFGLELIGFLPFF
jgi:hypothetical protein